MNIIKGIQIGEEGRYFTLKNDVNHSDIAAIKEEWKDVGPGKILVYRCYREDGKLLHEIEANNGLTISYL